MVAVVALATGFGALCTALAFMIRKGANGHSTRDMGTGATSRQIRENTEASGQLTQAIQEYMTEREALDEILPKVLRSLARIEQAVGIQYHKREKKDVSP